MKLGIYIQVPFCQSKCTYCNFHTGVFSSSLYSPYAAAVCSEIKRVCARVRAGAATVNTVYVGGGTPSLLAPSALKQMLDTLRESLNAEWQEVTLEADPETITPEKAKAWRAAGFNRISMGVQSFHDNELKAAGRMHRRKNVYAAMETLEAADFADVSFDLIAGLPHQTEASWLDSLEQLISMRPAHVSVYLMEIDEGSRLGKEVIAGGKKYSAEALPSDEQMAAFYEKACERLGAAGYEHYEISNWALPGHRSQHNLKYWQREPYLGFGAGAHSFDGTLRWANAHDPKEYVAAIERDELPQEQIEALSDQQKLDEELFLGLRLLEGVDIARIENQYGVKLQDRLQRLRDEGYLELEGNLARLAPSRLAVSNEVFVELMG